ncbi:ESX secretion-associated protein EspG [Nocardia transvalensis]|uniref:ESX secretion-associated protein EspG n=1 Tax=Nocardia transvalensis TaxID=37333 RepID=UPI001895362A|nr:ESX secretion-associated protein EspG [Nocardia transvalensis]MBF6327530.1 ESX secretion-associated protein EspG [Nocardia transvalensis]
MKRTWSFTDIEFVTLWEDLYDDNLPGVFTFLSDVENYYDYLRLQRQARERIRNNLDPAIYEVLDIVVRPDIQIVVRGFDGQDPENPKAGIRLLAVRRGNEGYLLEQLPGATVQHSGGFTVTECDAVRLADVVVAKLPKADAGSRARVTLPAPPSQLVDDEYGKSALWDTFDDSGGDPQSNWFYQQKPKYIGGIEVAQGISRFGPRGRTVRYLEWRDVLGDGRFVIVPTMPPAAVAVDERAFIAMINTEVATIVRAIKEERV